MKLRLLAVMAASALFAIAGQAQSHSGALQHSTMLDAKQRDAIDRGDAVTVTLDTPEKTEIMTLGVVRLEVPRAFYIEHVKQLTGFLARTQADAGTFSEPARVEDVALISLDPADAKSLEKCQPLKCDVKLPAADMERFRSTLAKMHDPLERADSLMRDWLVSYVNAYRADSAEETVVYDDTRRSVRSSEVFRTLLAEPMPSGIDSEPFESMLANRRSARPAGVTSRITWEIDRVPGLKPTLEVMQRSLYAPSSHPDRSWMTNKLLYATHYFESEVDYLTVVDAQAASGGPPASYLIVLRRQKFDDLPSGGLFNIRGKAVKKLRETLRTALTNTRAELSAAYSGAQPAQHAP